MKISELKVKKKIHRPTRNFDVEGERIYEEFEYILPYNPTHKRNERERLYAKTIDLIPFFLIFRYGFHELIIVSLLFSILCVLIFGTFCETLSGTTLGKRLFKLKVIDDFGNKPNIIKSAFRNILSFANFFPVFSEFGPKPNQYWEKSGVNMNFSMHLNNQITKTYIIKEHKLAEIRELLKDQQP